MNKVARAVLAVLFCCASAEAQSQFAYSTNNGVVTLVAYFGEYDGETGPVTISNFVNIVGEGAFSVPTVTAITIPDSVTNISNDAFNECTGLTNLVIPDSVVSIGDNAFHYCTGLTSITLGTSVSSMGYEVFSDCGNLTNLIIPNGVTAIGETAFHNCTNLGAVTIPGSVTNFGDSAFLDCTALASVTIENGVTNISDGAFTGCASLTNIVIPGSVTAIGQASFYECTALNSVILPVHLDSIANVAFQSCTNLTAVYFTGSAPAIIPNVFPQDSPALATYYLPGTSGWSLDFWGYPVSGPPALLWNPQIQTPTLSSGVFSFNITAATNLPVTVEASTNLADPVWIPLTNLTTINGSIYFSDPQSSNYPARFYGLGFP